MIDNLKPRNASERLPSVGQPWPTRAVNNGVLYMLVNGARLRIATAEERHQARKGSVIVDGVACGVEHVGG